MKTIATPEEYIAAQRRLDELVAMDAGLNLSNDLSSELDELTEAIHVWEKVHYPI